MLNSHADSVGPSHDSQPSLLDASLAAEWKAKGDRLLAAPGTTLTENGRTFHCRDLYIEALKHDPHAANIWGLVAKFTRTTERVIVNGESMSRRQCTERALTLDPKNADGWFCLVSAGTSSGNVTFDGVEYTPKECTMKAMKYDPNNASVWSAVAFIAEDFGNSVFVNGKEYNTATAYHHALLLEPYRFSRWCNMGCALDGSTPSVLSVEVNGATFTETDCYRHALEHCELHLFETWSRSEAWLNLSGSTPDDVSSITVKGAEYSKVTAAMEAVRQCPFDADVWVCLAYRMVEEKDEEEEEGLHVTLNGREYSVTDCLVEALRQDPSARLAWQYLSQILPSDETVIMVSGVPYTAEECDEQTVS